MKLLVFGSCNIDRVYRLDHIVAPGETERACDYAVFPGGKGLNQAIAAAAAGAEVRFAGAVGQDGELLTETLSSRSVDISLLQKTNGASGHAVIQVSDGGENAIFLYPGANEIITDAYIDAVLAHFEAPAEIRAIRALGGDDDLAVCLQNLAARYPHLQILLTLGADGCMLVADGETLRQAAFETTVVDTTAAGDTFTGYFAAAITRGEAYRDALQTASAAAAIAVSRSGAAPSIPALAEVRAAMPGMRERQPAAE